MSCAALFLHQTRSVWAPFFCCYCCCKFLFLVRFCRQEGGHGGEWIDLVDAGTQETRKKKIYVGKT